MKIRENHFIRDRMFVIVILLCLLLLLGKLAAYIEHQKENTIEKFLKTAVEPVGRVMYIWGGGWDEEDEGSSGMAAYIGLSPQWEIFAAEQDESYDFNEHRFERENGLDCSGFVGWVMYNTFETQNGKEGYVLSSTDMARYYAECGYGTFLENPSEFLAGDIVSMEGHVWICLGTCADGSVLLVHSSPPGVSVCGTQKEGDEESIAVSLATSYMEHYHLDWQQKYPNRAVSETYLENVSVMRWNTDVMPDAQTIQHMSAEEMRVLLDRFS